VKRLVRIVHRLALAVIACWIVGCFLSFLSGALLSIFPIPWRMPLPWSDFGDFVETPDGRVLVELRFYNRILCYDRSGEFVTGYRLPHGAKDTRLAVGQDNLVYVRAQNAVYSYSPAWELIAVAKHGVKSERIWELSLDTGQPVHAPRRQDLPPDRAVVPGDLLFSSGERRVVFCCTDGATLRRKGSSLERLSPTGDVTATYATAWPLRPFVFPFPALLAWVAVFAIVPWLAFLARRRVLRMQKDPQRNPKEQTTV
jgi:hypothetical protein